MTTTTTCELAATQNQQLNKFVAKTYKYALLKNVHLTLHAPVHSPGETIYTRGKFNYFHYGCDGTLDTGWGCGYRTLQTAISWIINKRNQEMTQNVPSIEEIQRTLVEIGDKPSRFIGSRDWIGTLEEFYVIDAIFENLPCRIVHVQQLNSQQIIEQIRKYFEEYCGFIAMGGMSDMASKGIAGIHLSQSDGVSLLIVDPHFSGVPSSKEQLIHKGYVRWMHISEFEESAYNLCFILQK
ncbi:probable Ufm1-specific protease 1 [Drosophila grimshawi]|uniref:GH19856 n=1 Tax=Drosophila grimshawi TaxID=7222 RepID=B4J9I1_DROGR|nr:probable Ufm1-specific protease 1 [Drosophila grimshawi]EDW02488.1 GH19856 [Drosophila grimshawi]